MNARNFLNMHVLISHSPSCLNRDDMNMQKSAIFGGVRRVRISGQCLKRAMRKSDYYDAHLGQPSDRTRELGMIREKYVAALKDRYSSKQVIRAIEWISGKEGIAEDTRADAVAPWAVEEVAHFCKKIADAGDNVDQKKLAKEIEKEAKMFRAAASSALDIALSGRMATSGLMTSVDGALAVAHSITTHAVDADIDWFAAVDDLVEEKKQRRVIGQTDEGEGSRGAGHLNTQEFSSGVFYRYASLNLKQLQVNLGLLPDMKSEETPNSRKVALEIAKHAVHMLATVIPSAKQRSFAAHNLADLAIADFSNIPISLANAFETPVRREKNEGGFMVPSIRALVNYWDTVHRGYGIEEKAAVFSLKDLDVPGDLMKKDSVQGLEAWVENDGED